MKAADHNVIVVVVVVEDNRIYLKDESLRKPNDVLEIERTAVVNQRGAGPSGF